MKKMANFFAMKYLFNLIFNCDIRRTADIVQNQQAWIMASNLPVT